MRKWFVFIGFLWLLLPLGAQEAVNGKRIVKDSLATDSVRRIPYDQMLGSYGSPIFYDGLHPGLNASLSLSASVGFGHHAPSGVGFGRDVDLVYASPLKSGLYYTVGVNSSNMNWGGFRYNQAGVGGSLGYAPSDCFSFDVSAYKDLVRPNNLVPRLDFRPNQYVGATAHMKFWDNVFIQVSVGTFKCNY